MGQEVRAVASRRRYCTTSVQTIAKARGTGVSKAYTCQGARDGRLQGLRLPRREGRASPRPSLHRALRLASSVYIRGRNLGTPATQQMFEKFMANTLLPDVEVRPEDVRSPSNRTSAVPLEGERREDKCEERSLCKVRGCSRVQPLEHKRLIQQGKRTR